MNTAKVLIIIFVLNALLIVVPTYAMNPETNTQYVNIYSQGQTDGESFQEDFTSDDTQIGTGTGDQGYDQSAMNTIKSQRSIIGLILYGLRGVDTDVYDTSDMITRIILDVVAFIRVLSGIIVALLLIQLIKNRKTD